MELINLYSKYSTPHIAATCNNYHSNVW